jgi:hypothetical protein
LDGLLAAPPIKRQSPHPKAAGYDYLRYILLIFYIFYIGIWYIFLLLVVVKKRTQHHIDLIDDWL